MQASDEEEYDLVREGVVIFTGALAKHLAKVITPTISLNLVTMPMIFFSYLILFTTDGRMILKSTLSWKSS